ncbi:hypothetical protein ACFO0M_22310 [Micromonospora mangrovi]|uniref:Uncharacterized protein n=2 Tax=Micromonospora TaxID=1873 RepID=A0AAU7M4F6_9ACTN
MRRTVLPVTAMVLAAALAGCQGADPVAGPGTPPPSTARAAAYPVRELPFTLYTHCGVNEVSIEGRWYDAVAPLSDGNGNPPPDWDHLFQEGTMRLTSPTEAEFHDSAGHVVTFRLRPGATEPRMICA